MATRVGSERVEFFRGRDRLWYFRRVAANNEIVAEGEGYQNHADALATADKLFANVDWWEQNGQDWRRIRMSENEGLEPQTVTEGTEDGEPLLDPQPEPENEEGVEDGPEPSEPWSEDEPGEDDE